MNGLKVSNTGYFVYCTGKRDQKAFDKKIEFDVILISHVGNDDWVEPTIYKIKEYLESDEILKSGNGCEYCAWWYARSEYEK